MILSAIQRLLLTLWVGALWAIGFLAAPVLFATLDDRMLAGMLAGRMFHLVSIISLISAAGIIAIYWLQIRQPWREWRLYIVLLMAVMMGLFAFVLQPQMAALKAAGIAEGTVNAARFAKLHGIAWGVYTLASLSGLILVVAGLRPVRRWLGES